MEMYYSHRKITDDTGKEYTAEEARAALAGGEVTDCNISFQRLTDMNFDVDAIEKYYDAA